MSQIPLLSSDEIVSLAAKNGWSIPDLCRAAGVAQSTYSRWVRGKNSLNTVTYRRVYEVASKTAAETVGG
jgi:transcriptional regulator with XRE-family HTH domain